MTNIEALEEILTKVNILNPIVRQYEQGTVTLADGSELPLSAAQITALKASGAAAKAALIAAAQEITG
jgi:hypothetical protein